MFRPLPYEIVGRRPGDLAETYANVDKARRELDWNTELTISDAMKDTINYLEHIK